MGLEEVESRRRSILDATLALFANKPFEEIGIRDIARKADVSSGTIYRYFPSQDDLYLEALLFYLDVVRGIVDANFEEIRKIREQEDNNSHEKIADLAADFMLANPAAFRIISHFMVTRKLDAATMQKFETLHQDFFRMFDKILARADAAEDDHTYFPLFLASIYGTVLTFRNMPGVAKEDVRQVVKKYTDVVAAVYKDGRE